ncbi:MAG: type IV secretory system conjugative DNA transfer family protein [Polyangiaceae bacterium]
MHRSYSGSGLFLGNRTESEHEFGRPLLTPAEVNQLPQDDGILLVGGLLPYRGRKVRYFLDPQFKGRDGWPAPDSAEDQARELLGRVATAWDEFIQAPAPSGWDIADRAHTPGAVAEESRAGIQGAAAVAQDDWECLFGAHDEAAVAVEEPEASDSPVTAKELPL